MKKESSNGFWLYLIQLGFMIFWFTIVCAPTGDVELFGYLWRKTSLGVYAAIICVVFGVVFGTVALIAARRSARGDKSAS